MKIYTYSQARQKLAEILNQARSEDVLIRRRGGDMFRITAEVRSGSPFDVDGVKTECKASDIVSAIRKVRER